MILVHFTIHKTIQNILKVYKKIQIKSIYCTWKNGSGNTGFPKCYLHTFCLPLFNDKQLVWNNNFIKYILVYFNLLSFLAKCIINFIQLLISIEKKHKTFWQPNVWLAIWLQKEFRKRNIEKCAYMKVLQETLGFFKCLSLHFIFQKVKLLTFICLYIEKILIFEHKKNNYTQLF